MADSSFKGTGRLARFIFRRDRIRIPLWLIGICSFTFAVPVSLAELYGLQEQRDMLAQTMQNPAMTAMLGPADFNNFTLGVMVAHEMVLFTALTVGLMSILLVTRHTRGDEESGRIEMIRSLPVGRLSSLNATLGVYTIANILLAVVIGLGLFSLHIESMDLEGSLLYGATLGGTGIFFAGVVALLAQITESSRSVIGFSIAILLLSYIVRGIGDVSSEALSWFSPLGWVTKTGIYGENNWLPIVIMLGVSIILFILANYLNAVRDLGAGFLPSRPGRKNASTILQSPIGLAIRLQRTGMISWAIGMFVLGASYGSILGDLNSFFEGNDMVKQMFAQEEGYSPTEQFVSMIIMVMAIIATIPPVMAMNKLYGEEKKGRIEHLLGRAVSRTRLMGSYLVIAVVNGFVMVSLSTIGLWVAGVSVMEEPFSFGSIYEIGIVYYPAMLVMISVSTLLIGYRQRFTSLIWLYVLYTFIVLYMGGLLQLPDWIGKMTPFGYIPKIPMEDMTWLPLMILVIVAVVFAVLGFVGYKRRDIEG